MGQMYQTEQEPNNKSPAKKQQLKKTKSTFHLKHSKAGSPVQRKTTAAGKFGFGKGKSIRQTVEKQ